MTRRLTLPKSTKLCSATAVDRLFQRDASNGTVAFPLRAVWRQAPERHHGDPVQFMITIPKKRLHHAVDRVTMRRRVREAYRLLRHEHTGNVAPGEHIDIAFIYLADKLLPYTVIAKAMNRILSTAFPPCATGKE